MTNIKQGRPKLRIRKISYTFVRLMMFSEYTRRYQDIYLNLPDEIYSGKAEIDERTLRYMRLYFDLCSEEYYLWKDHRIIQEEIWTMWLDGMKITTSNSIYIESWKELQNEYNDDFRNFFNKDVISANAFRLSERNSDSDSLVSCKKS